MRKSFAMIAAAALALTATGALANVLDPAVSTEVKAAAKHRADIAKQVSKYTFCLVKALQGCEKSGVVSGPECDLATGTASFEAVPGEVTAKFVAAIQKCDSKVDLTKKGTDYEAIGCPGDCNTGAPGVQECADIPAFQALVTAASASTPKGQLGALVSAIDFGCGIDTGAMPGDAERIDCVTDQAKVLSKYAQGVFKCQAKCENDFKDSKGNGGPSNGVDCTAGDPGADQLFKDCVQKGLDKALLKLTPTVATIIPTLNGVVNDATDGLYNRFDPTSTPDASPCGNCGNATREGAEECDGADATACPGMCTTACECP